MATSPLNPIYFSNTESVDAFVKPFDGSSAEKEQVYEASPSGIGREKKKTQDTANDGGS